MLTFTDLDRRGVENTETEHLHPSYPGTTKTAPQQFKGDKRNVSLSPMSQLNFDAGKVEFDNNKTVKKFLRTWIPGVTLSSKTND